MYHVDLHPAKLILKGNLARSLGLKTCPLKCRAALVRMLRTEPGGVAGLLLASDARSAKVADLPAASRGGGMGTLGTDLGD